MSAPRTIAVAINTAHGGAVKRVRVSLLPIYLRQGWHVVPRRRFKVAKKATERMVNR